MAWPRRANILMSVLLGVVCVSGSLWAADADQPAAKVEAGQAKAAPAEPAPLRTIALFEWKADWLDDPTQKQEVGEALTTIMTDRLSALPDVTLVERRQIESVMREQELNLTGLVDTEKAVKIGKLLGAKFLLSGRGFKSGDQIYVTTKIINAETGALKGNFITFPKSTATSEIIGKVCDDLAEKLPAKLTALAPQSPPTLEPIELLKKRLGAAAKSWVIVAYEEHKGPPIVDPAIENELEHLLSGAGQTVKTVSKDLARKLISNNAAALDAAKEQKADYCVIGQGFSEFGKRLDHDLVACLARVELKVVDVKTGAVLAAGSVETRATDLGELVAAKQALRKGAQLMLLDLAKKMADGLEAKKPEAEAKKAPVEAK